MRSRRTAQDEMAEITRRRLELLTAELAGIRGQPERPLDAVPAPEGEEPEPPAREAAVGTGAGPRPGTGDGLGWWPGPEVEPRGRGRHARRPVGPADRLGGWVHDRLPPTLQGRVRLSAAHLSVVALLVACGLAVTAWWVVRTDGSATVVPAATWSETAEATDAVVPGQLVTPAVDSPAETEGADVVVDVAGKVRRPGIATLPAGSRVVDAIEAAGGARRGVDLTGLNLARVLVDGEQIVVGVPPPGGVAAPAASSVVPGASAGPMVNINTASQAELEELPGVGPVTATAILQWRTDNGPFTAVDELLEVSGIGDATLAEIAPFVTL
jgi:competence protein ComEA